MNSKNTSKHYGVLGAGSFGTAIANLLAENNKVLLYTRNEEQKQKINKTSKNNKVDVHKNIKATTDLKELSEKCTLIFPIVPSDNLIDLLDEISAYLNPSHILIHGIKGFYTPKKIIKNVELNREDVYTMSQLIALKTGVVRIGCLAGPNLASELSDNQPAATVIASEFNEVIEQGRIALKSLRFQVYKSNEIRGVELAGILKNYVAIAAGLLVGLGYGENARSLLVTRGMGELIYIAKTFNIGEKAFLGLAGIGDLMATCHSKKSRNFRVGVYLSQGKKLNEITPLIGEVAEGIKTLQIVKALQKYGFNAPIAEVLYKIIFENYEVKKGIDFLMRFSTNEDADYIV